MTLPILATGARGQLGQELQRQDVRQPFTLVALDRDEMNLADPSSVKAAFVGRQWAAVINCAAYTAVDAAEDHPVDAWSANALGPAALAEQCRQWKIPLVQISTDYVFGGERGAYGEEEEPSAPLNVYGASKLGGELAVRASGARHAILRTSWLISAHGKNFVKTMLNLAEQHECVRVVDDQVGSPTTAADLAAAALLLATRMAADAQAPAGVFHFCNAGRTSWAGLAKEIFRQSRQRGGRGAHVEPIPTSAYPTRARRPLRSALESGRIERAFGIVPRPWQDALSDILDELIGGHA
jgi:dTDP-4-dehydrorhamnose reductase